jgi:hypothetical protein
MTPGANNDLHHCTHDLDHKISNQHQKRKKNYLFSATRESLGTLQRTEPVLSGSIRLDASSPVF